MASSLLLLLDDIASVLDDVATMTKVAAKKTAAVVGDDLALNAKQVTGVEPDRELAVVWSVAKGSSLNKAILVPAALAISWLAPWAIPPLLVIGGAFLCFEGAEKIVHSLLHRRHGEGHGDGPVDASERAKVRGAIRTDFILSAEIIVITLGTMAAAPMPQQVAALSAIGFLVTVLVYGLVAGIVKLDDLGLRLIAAGGAARTFGTGILRSAPWLLKGLGIGGTIAMFLVGGTILAHGIPVVGHGIEGVASGIGRGGALLTMALEGAVGVAAGGVIVGGLALVRRVRSAGAAA